MNPLATPHAGSGAPSRYRRVSFALAFALVAAPAVWWMQSSIAYGIASEACYPGYAPLDAPVIAGVNLIGLGLVAVSLAVALAGLLIGWRTWNRTRGEQAGGHEHLLEVGEGRTRFLALCAALACVLFAIATLFELVALVVLQPCL